MLMDQTKNWGDHRTLRGPHELDEGVWAGDGVQMTQVKGFPECWGGQGQVMVTQVHLATGVYCGGVWAG